MSPCSCIPGTRTSRYKVPCCGKAGSNKRQCMYNVALHASVQCRWSPGIAAVSIVHSHLAMGRDQRASSMCDSAISNAARNVYTHGMGLSLVFQTKKKDSTTSIRNRNSSNRACRHYVIHIILRVHVHGLKGRSMIISHLRICVRNQRLKILEHLVSDLQCMCSVYTSSVPASSEVVSTLLAPPKDKSSSVDCLNAAAVFEQTTFSCSMPSTLLHALQTGFINNNIVDITHYS